MKHLLVILILLISNQAFPLSDNTEELLGRNWSSKSEKDKLVYIDKLKKSLHSASSKLVLKAYLRIGDIYYNLAKYRSMKRWYSKALKKDPSLTKKSPAIFRMEKANKIIFRQNLIIITSILDGLIALYLLFIIVSGWSCKSFMSLLHRLGIAFVIFIPASILFLIIDNFFTKHITKSVINENLTTLVTPVFELSLFDKSFFFSLLMILLLGFLPFFTFFIYTSFTKYYSRWKASALIFLTASSLWTSFFVMKGYNNQFEKKTLITPFHFYLKGEVKDIIDEEPQKLIKANPHFRDDKNEDLEKYLTKHSGSVRK